ncbi:GTPase HflX [Dellaglioa algida]|nr:GTPase HflX [Dellaglioa algida]
MKETYSTEIPVIDVFIAGIEKQRENLDYTMSELAALVEANNMHAVEDIRQKLDRPTAALYFGKGKAEEFKAESEAQGVKILVVNDELSPTQIRNLEAASGMEVMDRTGLILAIFASRAQSREAKLQVQMAQLQYQLPRLRGMQAKLDQQSGGAGLANRGAGETKIELDRRVIENRITHIKKDLAEMDKEESTRRKQRDKSGIPTVALVGYTNSGKSTTMNGLLRLIGQDEDKQVFEKNMLFATLDTSVRNIQFEDKKQILLSDTVGFVSKLPHQLVKAFRTTLAEAAQADLLIQVIDVADKHAEEMIQTTEETLKAIGVENIPMIYAYNKADLADIAYPTFSDDKFTYSARDEASLNQLVDIIKKNVFKDNEIMTVLIPFDKGQIVDLINEKATILETTYEESGTKLKIDAPKIITNQVQDYIV